MGSNFNPISILQMIRGGSNPEQIMMNYLQEKLQGTPFGENLMQLAKDNNTAEIEKIARNLCEQQGLDYDKEFTAFKQRLGL